MIKYNKYVFDSIAGQGFDCMGDTIFSETVITHTEEQAKAIIVKDYGKEVLAKLKITSVEPVELFTDTRRLVPVERLIKSFDA
jgi:hypothetical protein